MQFPQLAEYFFIDIEFHISTVNAQYVFAKITSWDELSPSLRLHYSLNLFAIESLAFVQCQA